MQQPLWTESARAVTNTRETTSSESTSNDGGSLSQTIGQNSLQNDFLSLKFRNRYYSLIQLHRTLERR
jgi:hypothetical protein